MLQNVCLRFLLTQCLSVVFGMKIEKLRRFHEAPEEFCAQILMKISEKIFIFFSENFHLKPKIFLFLSSFLFTVEIP
jgi:hypothetical protein